MNEAEAPESLTGIDWKMMMQNDLLDFRNSLQVNFHSLGSHRGRMAKRRMRTVHVYR